MVSPSSGCWKFNVDAYGAKTGRWVVHDYQRSPMYIGFKRSNRSGLLRGWKGGYSGWFIFPSLVERGSMSTYVSQIILDIYHLGLK